jgi:hypothetical protein
MANFAMLLAMNTGTVCRSGLQVRGGLQYQSKPTNDTPYQSIPQSTYRNVLPYTGEQSEVRPVIYNRVRVRVRSLVATQPCVDQAVKQSSVLLTALRMVLSMTE